MIALTTGHDAGPSWDERLAAKREVYMAALDAAMEEALADVILPSDKANVLADVVQFTMFMTTLKQVAAFGLKPQLHETAKVFSAMVRAAEKIVPTHLLAYQRASEQELREAVTNLVKPS